MALFFLSMALLSVANLELSFGERKILDGVNLTLEAGEHVGMVGRNGCGKSTLLKLIAGIDSLKPDAGHVQLARGVVSGYLSQTHDLNPENTLREEAGSAFEHINKLHKKIDKLTAQMGDADEGQLEKLMKQYERYEHELEAAGGYALDHKVDATLHGLGIGDQFFDVKVEDLSGGQCARVALAKLLLSEPDILLLDEPTNHLDIAAREWLEDYLNGYPGAVLLVSHDRRLLDSVVTRIIEIDQGRVEEYPGNYMKFRELRAERQAFKQREFEKHQDRIKSEKAFIDRYRAGQRSKQAQGREKRLDRYIKDSEIEQPLDQGVMKLSLRAEGRAGDIVFSVENISKGYEGKPLFSDFTFTIKRGHRIGIIGPNGAGKTTFVNCMLDESEADSGRVKMGSEVSVGYYRQTHEYLDLKESVVEYLERVTPSSQSACDLAGAFLFTGTEQQKPLSVMSGGERARCVLAGLVAGGHNLLVLDEPSNHLDIVSAERLEEALMAYTAERKGWGEQITGGGTMILISHDRMLLDNLVDELFVLDGDGEIKHVYGNYSEYHESVMREKAAGEAEVEEKKAEEKAKADARKKKEKPQAKQEPVKKKGPKPSGAHTKLSQKALEMRIAELEDETQTLNDQLADPETYKEPEKAKAYQKALEKAAGELQLLEEEWLRRSEDG